MKQRRYPYTDQAEGKEDSLNSNLGFFFEFSSPFAWIFRAKPSRGVKLPHPCIVLLWERVWLCRGRKCSRYVMSNGREGVKCLQCETDFKEDSKVLWQHHANVRQVQGAPSEMIIMAKSVNQSKKPKHLPSLYSAWCMMWVFTWCWVQSAPCTTVGGASRARIFSLHHYLVKAEGVFCPPLFTCCHLESITSEGCWGPRKPGFL